MKPLRPLCPIKHTILPMAEIETLLSRLGISEYTTRFLAEGFDICESIMDVTETDLAYLAVNLAHWKRLQQEILNARGHIPGPCSKLPDHKARHKYIYHRP
jgi:hypothetical protein